MPIEPGGFEPGTSGIQQLLAETGGGVLYAFTLRAKRVAVHLVLQEVSVVTTITS